MRRLKSYDKRLFVEVYIGFTRGALALDIDLRKKARCGKRDGRPSRTSVARHFEGIDFNHPHDLSTNIFWRYKLPQRFFGASRADLSIIGILGVHGAVLRQHTIPLGSIGIPYRIPATSQPLTTERQGSRLTPSLKISGTSSVLLSLLPLHFCHSIHSSA